MDEAAAGLSADRIYLVPMFMSAGGAVASLAYLPAFAPFRESLVTCEPIGLSPLIPAIVAGAARAAAAGRGVSPAETTVLVVGHGSRGNPASRDATLRLCAAIADGGGFARVQAAFLEEAPLLDSALAGLSPPAVVVGFFAAAGRHAGVEIPAAIAAHAPFAAYTGAIGDSPDIIDVIEERIAAAGA
jgi:sirohydrochlorin ferrochelatase